MHAIEKKSELINYIHCRFIAMPGPYQWFSRNVHCKKNVKIKKSNVFGILLPKKKHIFIIKTINFRGELTYIFGEKAALLHWL